MRQAKQIVAFMCLAFLVGWGIWSGIVALDYNWQWYRVPRYFFKETDGAWVSGPLLLGFWMTLKITAMSSVFTIVVGFLVALASRSSLVTLRGLSRSYVEGVRNTPLLVQLYLFYFMMANVLGTDPFWTGVFALAFFEAAFAAEIFRSGFDAVPSGQWDASRALGLGKGKIYRLVVVPQMMPLILPPMANLGVNLFKHSSIVTIIAVPDLTNEARNIISETYLVFEIWFAVAAMYISVAWLFSFAIGRWESRLRRRG